LRSSLLGWRHQASIFASISHFDDPPDAELPKTKRPGPLYFFGDRSPAQNQTQVVVDATATAKEVSMRDARTLRRTTGFISSYFSNALLKSVGDPRSEQGRRWKSALPLLRTVCVGLAAGCQGLLAVENLTKRMTKKVRKLIGIHRYTPDTTLRDYICVLNPYDICRLIWIVGYDALRRKAIRTTSLFPWGIISMDGKYPTVRDIGDGEDGPDRYLQVHHDKATGEALYGVIRVITGVLITAVGRPVLGATPVPGDTNEQGHFKQAFGELVRAYGRYFRLVLYDAGAASLSNADAVLAAGKHYFFQIADPRWVMYQTIELLLSGIAPAARTEELKGSKRIVRELTMRTVSATAKSLTLWPHTRTIFKVYSETYEHGVLKSTKTRYFVTSLTQSELSPENWLALIVLRWAVETVHQILDCAFQEDKHPWITKDANGALVLMLLRRLVFTLMTLYKSVTLRSDENREMTWPELMAQIKDTLEWAQGKILDGLRPRTFAVPPALA